MNMQLECFSEGSIVGKTQDLENRIISFLNSASTPAKLVNRLTIGGKAIVNRKTAASIIAYRRTLPRQAFRSLADLRAVPGIPKNWLGDVGKAFDDTPRTDIPVLLLPVRLEIRLLGSDLVVRCYPDQIFLNAHQPLLAEAERTAGIEYFEVIEASPDDEKAGRDAWRALARKCSQERAAWVVKVVGPAADRAALPIRSEEERQLVIPTLAALPERFVVYAFRGDTLVRSQAGNAITKPLSYLSTPGRGSEPFDDQSARVANLDQAEKDGMAVRLTLTDTDRAQGFSKIIVVGLRKTTPEARQRLLEDLLDAHHYSTGLGFVNPGTPTNNTRQARSGYSESTEDRESSYDIEILGTANWENPANNARRLGSALGLGPDLAVLRHQANAGDTSVAFAEEMHTAVWPATGDYLLRYLLPGLVSDTDRTYAGNHFVRFVRGLGPLPTMRVGELPQGFLPATSVLPWSATNPLGWKESKLDDPTGKYPIHFDQRLHAILTGLYWQWLTWAQDTRRVPRADPSDDPSYDPDRELLRMLAMQPQSVSYRARPFVNEQLVAFMLLALRDYVFGAETPYHLMNASPLHWVRRWRETWYQECREQAAAWGSVTGAKPEKFENSPLFGLLAWWNDQDLLLDLVRRVAVENGETGEDPLQYLRSLCQGTENATPVQTLLRDVLERSLRLANTSCFDADCVREAICRLSASSGLEFFNTATEADQIVRKIRDDADFGVASPRAYGVRPSLVRRILEERARLPGGMFTSIDQIDRIPGVGKDTFHDINYSFRNQALPPDLDRLFRESLDLCTHRLDAWITSLATKRLEAMRTARPTGIYLGAYGCVEDPRFIQKGPSSPQSEGYLHAPTAAAKAAAVLYNSYLTHRDGGGANPSASISVRNGCGTA
jgi:hypothetical protein